jgi:hypothetical protein
MSALLFLLLAVLVSSVGCAVLWYQHRSPNTLDSGIKAFQREMDALAPPGDEPVRPRAEPTERPARVTRPERPSRPDGPR